MIEKLNLKDFVHLKNEVEHFNYIVSLLQKAKDCIVHVKEEKKHNWEEKVLRQLKRDRQDEYNVYKKKVLGY